MPAPRTGAAQWFVFGGQVFDITAATSSIIRARPRETVGLPVGPWARAYGLDRDPGSDNATIPLLGPGPGFNRAYAMTTNLTQPLIIAALPVTGDEPAALLIDGTHRLYKGARHRSRAAARLGAHPGRDPRDPRPARKPGAARLARAWDGAGDDRHAHRQHLAPRHPRPRSPARGLRRIHLWRPDGEGLHLRHPGDRRAAPPPSPRTCSPPSTTPPAPTRPPSWPASTGRGP